MFLWRLEPKRVGAIKEKKNESLFGNSFFVFSNKHCFAVAGLCESERSRSGKGGVGALRSRLFAVKANKTHELVPVGAAEIMSAAAQMIANIAV